MSSRRRLGKCGAVKRLWCAVLDGARSGEMRATATDEVEERVRSWASGAEVPVKWAAVEQCRRLAPLPSPRRVGSAYTWVTLRCGDIGDTFPTATEPHKTMQYNELSTFPLAVVAKLKLRNEPNHKNMLYRSLGYHFYRTFHPPIDELREPSPINPIALPGNGFGRRLGRGV
jgi:hypothetical protein